MGAILSKFRKQPTTMEQLKKIEDSLRKIEDYKRITEKKQKRTVANVIIYGAALYILACVIVFVWYLPESWLVRLGLLIPLILVPVIIYWMKRFISKYFQSKMTRANEDFLDLQRKKTEIIDNIMDTETFNKAKEILSKYAPEKLEKKERTTPPGPLPGKSSPTDLRKRAPGPGGSNNKGVGLAAPKPQQFPVSLATQNQLTLYNRKTVSSTMSQRAPMPQPLFPRERTFSDKLVEYIVGDGPGYRYALICKFCHGHNGMALKEEFPFMSYTCCYCTTFNPARSQRPLAPRLPDLVDPPSLPESAPRKTLDGIERLNRKKVNTSVKKDDDEPAAIPFDKFMEQLDAAADGNASEADDKIPHVAENETPVEDPLQGPSNTVDESDNLPNEEAAESSDNDLTKLLPTSDELTASSLEADEKS